MSETGRAVPHESARGHVTGSAHYTDDLGVRFPHLLHAWPVLSPHAHANVSSLRVDAALDVPGVVRVLSEADVPGEGNTGSNRHDEPMFPREVMFHGHPVAWVLADSLDAAQRGAGRVQVDYTVLPAILSIDDAIRAQSFLTGPLKLTDGNLTVLERSPFRIQG